MNQVSKNISGLAISTVEEAMPYMQLKEPLTSGGLALLIIDHDDSRIPQDAELVKFPAQYHKTNEPILLTAAVMQLGSQKVQRTYPKQMTSINEIKTQVIRVLAYRDQVPYDWTTLYNKPAHVSRRSDQQHP